MHTNTDTKPNSALIGPANYKLLQSPVQHYIFMQTNKTLFIQTHRNEKKKVQEYQLSFVKKEQNFNEKLLKS